MADVDVEFLHLVVVFHGRDARWDDAIFLSQKGREKHDVIVFRLISI